MVAHADRYSRKKCFHLLIIIFFRHGSSLLRLHSLSKEEHNFHVLSIEQNLSHYICKSFLSRKLEKVFAFFYFAYEIRYTVISFRYSFPCYSNIVKILLVVRVEFRLMNKSYWNVGSYMHYKCWSLKGELFLTPNTKIRYLIHKNRSSFYKFRSMFFSLKKLQRRP